MMVRAMTAADIEAVMAMERKTPSAPHWGMSAYQACVDGAEAAPPAAEAGGPLTRVAVVAEQEGTLAGFAVVRLAGGMCELESIAVAAEWRRRGVGAALMRSVMEWARDRGAAKLELEVRESNSAAVRLYETLGGSVAGRRARYYCDPVEDAVLMEIDLRG
jgi:ribosomal-protein-alanine N-acetyltransferase